MPLPLTLASNSWGRRQVLTDAGYTFDVKPSNIPEPTEAIDGDIRRYVGDLAWRKAAAVAPTVAEGVVIAADTVGWLDGKVVGKPDDAADARRILTWLGGREHELWTGVCLWVRPAGWQVCWQEVSVVHMAAMDAPQLDEYLATRHWEGCSGAYAVKFPADPLVTVTRGSITNVIGLPIESVRRFLKMIEEEYSPQRAREGAERKQQESS